MPNVPLPSAVNSPAFPTVFPAEYSESLTRFCASGWPPFIWNDPIMQTAWPLWFRYFPEYQYEFQDSSGVRLACVHTVPLRWEGSAADLPDGRDICDECPVPTWETAIQMSSTDRARRLSGWDWVITQSVCDYLQGIQPNVLSAAATVVSPQARGTGLAGEAVKWMKEIARARGLKYVIAPLRPSHKRDFPHMDFAQYCQKSQTREDGQVYPYDPWLRLHVKLGGTLIKPCWRSIRIRQPLSVWESWLAPDSLTPHDIGSKNNALPHNQIPLPGADSLLTINQFTQTAYYSASGMWAIHENDRR